jgi:hypothetical protein
MSLTQVADSPGRSLERSLISLAKLLAFPALYLFFTGFLYAYYYFASFGISLRNVDSSFNSYLVYSLSVFFQHAFVTLLLLVFFGVLVVRFRRTSILLCFLLLLFPVLFMLARATGEGRAIALRNGTIGHRVRVLLKEPEKYSAGFVAIAQSNELILVTETEKQFYVMLQKYPQQPVHILPFASVYEISKDSIALAEIEVGTVKNLRVQNEH